MNMSNLFKSAHILTKQVIKAGDNYAITFGACLKELVSISKGMREQLSIKKLTASSVINACLNDYFINRKDVLAIRNNLLLTVEKSKILGNVLKVNNFTLALSVLNNDYDIKGCFKNR